MEKKSDKALQATRTGKLYDIIKDFDGKVDGETRHFYAGSEGVELPDNLAAVTVRKGWAREVKPCAS